MLQRSFLAVLGGFLLTASFEPLALPWLLPFGVAAFALVTRDLTVRRAGLVGLLFGIAFYFTHIAWMRTSVGPDAWAALAGIEAAFYGLLGLATPLLRRLPWWPVWLAAAWTTMETVRSGFPFSGMPWGRLSFAAIDTPAAPMVAYAGMTGLSFLLALLGFLLARAVEERTLPHVAAVVGLLVVFVGPAVWPFTVSESGTARVAVVQGDVPGPGNDILYDPQGVTENHVDATVRLAQEVAAGQQPRPDFVLWPENSTAVDPFADVPVNAMILRAVEAVGVPVVVGAIVDDGPQHILNQGIVWDPVTGAGERYTKHHPVPYGEYIPFRDIWDPKFGQARPDHPGHEERHQHRAPARGGDPGGGRDLLRRRLRRRDAPAGAGRRPACSPCRPATRAFIFTHQIEQQFAITRLRAIEAGRWLTVASTNGRTGIIRPDGSVVDTAGIRSTAVLSEQVGLSTGLTPAMRLGAWPTRLFTGSTLGALVAGAIAYRRGREFAGPVHVPAKEPTDAC
ncbi:apolipoprotein N-acyltransferase [Nocardioides sp. W3-2-3]|uniref:apolipoprotein N-acyltransferase n=1 Tax=Nocardioides convexus TaxID=2712224 RepID=UPI0024186E04|nr:apolipoprotein N-acyltransferase [Nocardioides convexus]NGZ99751.1 apolipoprotein N-acyltransferase [Nocardioides convexus]